MPPKHGQAPGDWCCHRVTDGLRWEGSSGLHLVQPPGLVAQDCVHVGLRSSNDGDSTTSLGNLCQDSGTLAVRSFLMFRGPLPCSSVCPWALVLALGSAGKGLAPSSWHLPAGTDGRG